MSYLFNLLFIVAAGAVGFVAVRRRYWRLLWVLVPVALIAILYNAVTPLAVRRVDLDFVAEAARKVPELTGYRIDPMERVFVRPLTFNEVSGDYDDFVDVEVNHPWCEYTQFSVKIQFLLEENRIVGILPSLDRKNSGLFSGFSTGPDRVHVPDYISIEALAGDTR